MEKIETGGEEVSAAEELGLTQEQYDGFGKDLSLESAPGEEEIETLAPPQSGEPSGEQKEDQTAGREEVPKGKTDYSLSILAKKDRERVTKEKELRELESQVKPVSELLSQLKTNPAAFLDLVKLSGLTPEQVIEAMVSAPQAAEERKGKELEQENQRLKQEHQESLELRRQEGDKQITSFIVTELDKVEQYPTLNMLDNATDIIKDALIGHFNETGEAVPVEKVCELVEQALFEDRKSKVATVKQKQEKVKAAFISKYGFDPTEGPAELDTGKKPSGKKALSKEDSSAPAERKSRTQSDNDVIQEIEEMFAPHWNKVRDAL